MVAVEPKDLIVMRKWLIDAIKEALAGSSSLQLRQETLLKQLDSLAIIVQAQNAQLERIERGVTEASDAARERAESQSSESRPLANSRPTWPRMKRQLEERDVRTLLQERQQDRQSEQQLSPELEEASAVSRYWRNKQRNLNFEGESNGSSGE